MRGNRSGIVLLKTIRFLNTLHNSYLVGYYSEDELFALRNTKQKSLSNNVDYLAMIQQGLSSTCISDTILHCNLRNHIQDYKSYDIFERL